MLNSEEMQSSLEDLPLEGTFLELRIGETLFSVSLGQTVLLINPLLLLCIPCIFVEHLLTSLNDSNNSPACSSQL